MCVWMHASDKCVIKQCESVQFDTVCVCVSVPDAAAEHQSAAVSLLVVLLKFFFSSADARLPSDSVWRQHLPKCFPPRWEGFSIDNECLLSFVLRQDREGPRVGTSRASTSDKYYLITGKQQ